MFPDKLPTHAPNLVTLVIVSLFPVHNKLRGRRGWAVIIHYFTTLGACARGVITVLCVCVCVCVCVKSSVLTSFQIYTTR